MFIKNFLAKFTCMNSLLDIALIVSIVQQNKPEENQNSFKMICLKFDQKYKSDQKAHEGEIFQCSKCNENFNSKIRLKSHFAKGHNRSKHN